MDKQISRIMSVDNISRTPKKLSKSRGHHTYDDSAWNICVYIPLIGLQELVEADWMKRIVVYAYKITMHCWFGSCPGEQTLYYVIICPPPWNWTLTLY